MEILLPILLIMYLMSSKEESIIDKKQDLQEEKNFFSQQEYFLKRKYNIEITKETQTENIKKKDFVYNIMIDKSESYSIRNQNNNIIIQLVPKNINEINFNLKLIIENDKGKIKKDIEIDHINKKEIKVNNQYIKIKITPIEYSEKFNQINNLICYNKKCEIIKENTIKRKKES